MAVAGLEVVDTASLGVPDFYSDVIDRGALRLDRDRRDPREDVLEDEGVGRSVGAGRQVGAYDVRVCVRYRDRRTGGGVGERSVGRVESEALVG